MKSLRSLPRARIKASAETLVTSIFKTVVLKEMPEREASPFDLVFMCRFQGL